MAGWAAYPRMDEQGIDALVIHKLLGLTRELRVVVHAVEDSDLSSLQVARCIQANVLLRRDTPTPMCAATTGEARDAPEDSSSPQVVASIPGKGWMSGDWPRRDTDLSRKRTSPRREQGRMTCFNCGLQGHVASGCRAPRQC
ncbi:unnamed protein product [Lampetra fluviatilis]